MGLFRRSINDEEWQRQVMPSYQAGLALASSLDTAIEDELVGDQIEAMEQILRDFPEIIQMLKVLPDPASAQARQAKENLERALKGYVDGAKKGLRFFRDVVGGPGERLQRGGFSTRAAASRLAFEQGLYQEIIKTARKRMDQVIVFFA